MAIKNMGFERKHNSVSVHSIYVEGRDVIGQAPTGIGKITVSGIPVLGGSPEEK